jgi:hypothetical protein
MIGISTKFVLFGFIVLSVFVADQSIPQRAPLTAAF